MSKYNSSSKKQKGDGKRPLRVGEQMKQILAGVFERGEFAAPVLQTTPITVTEVQVTPDLRLAKVYIMPLGGINAKEVLVAARDEAIAMQQQVAGQVRMKYLPKLRFFLDDTFEEAARIEAALGKAEVARDIGSEL